MIHFFVLFPRNWARVCSLIALSVSGTRAAAKAAADQARQTPSDPRHPPPLHLGLLEHRFAPARRLLHQQYRSGHVHQGAAGHTPQTQPQVLILPRRKKKRCPSVPPPPPAGRKSEKMRTMTKEEGRISARKCSKRCSQSLSSTHGAGICGFGIIFFFFFCVCAGGGIWTPLHPVNAYELS